MALLVCAGCGASDQSDAIDPTCPDAPAGVSTAPTTITGAVDLANALYAARPADSSSVSISCYLQRLSRPLTTLGVLSVFSLQPADGERSPRVFVFSGPLVMSVAPAGAGSASIELAEYPSPLRSIKAELAFPVTAPVPASEPFERIRDSHGTVCGGCHRDETESSPFAGTKVYESGVFKPRLQDVVPLPYMQDQTRTCDRAREPYRCAMLRALFDNRNVLTGAFAADAPTIFE